MFHGGDFTAGDVSDSANVHLLRIPIDGTWPLAPAAAATDVDDFLRAAVRRATHDGRLRLQRTIDAVESQVAVLDLDGRIIAVNRAWRMTAKMYGMSHPHGGVGLNYLAVCRNGAAAGEQSAALAAEGIDGVLQARSRSFFFKYAWRCESERRYYAMQAWRVEDDGVTYVVVAHELLEAHAAW